MSGSLSRSELVGWINETLQTQVYKIDDLGTGAEYCQIMDSIYGDIPMHRVRFNSRQRFDWEANMKVLQQAFTRHNIVRDFDTQRLMRCKLQDNLEFTQWLYQFWHSQVRIPDYDPIFVRSTRKSTTGTASIMSGGAPQLRTQRSFSGVSTSSGRSQAKISSYTVTELIKEKQRLESDNQKLIESATILEREREDYYCRLVAIEKIIAEHIAAHGELSILDDIQKLMFAPQTMEIAVEPLGNGPPMAAEGENDSIDDEEPF